jgi:uncharacterized protein
MLRIDLGALRHGSIDVAQTVSADDALFEGLEFQLSHDVRLSGRLMEAGSGRYYWRGTLETQICSPCRRCLAPVSVDISHQVEVLFTEDEAADDPAAYVLLPRAMEIDPGDAVREELILSVPNFVLCTEECRGLCVGCGTDLNSGSCGCEPEPDQRWAVLESLKTAQHEEGRE